MRETVDNAPTIWLAASENYSGGMDSATDPRDIDKLQLQLVRNGYISLANRAVRRPGFTSLLASDFASPIRAIRRFRDANGLYSGLIVWEGGNVWDVSDAGVTRLLIAHPVETPAYDVAHCEFAEAIYYEMEWAGLYSIQVAETAASAHVYSPYARFTSGYYGTALAGDAGNVYTLTVTKSAPGGSLSASMTGTDISAVLATDGAGVITSTNTEVVAALNGVAAMPVDWTAVDGAALAVEVAETQFYGGADVGQPYAALVLYDYDFCYLAAREGSDRIFGIDVADPASLRWCDALTPGTWNSANVWRPGGRFTGIVEIAGVLLAFQEERIMRVDGTDPTTWSTVRASAEGLGLPLGASATLRELEGVAVYLSQTGLTVFDGSRPRVISNAVKSREQACRNFIPLTADEWDGSFIDVWRDFLLVFYKSDGSDTGCNRVLLYDFRRSIFAGVWELPEPVTCSSCDETGDGVAAALLLGTVSGNILRENDLFLDNGVAFEFGAKSKVYDCGREAIDKQVIEMRAPYYAGGPTTLTMSLYREGDVTPCATVAHGITAEGEGVIVKRVHHMRGRDFRVEFSQTDDVYLEVNGNEFDYFFAARR
jgi:hypothetical protein